MSRKLDRRINPLTGDYVMDGAKYEYTSTIETGCYHQCKGQRNRWPGDPNAGSDLYLIPTKGLTRSTVVFAEDAIRRALQPFIDSGDATDLQIETEVEPTFGRLILQSSITDVQAGQLNLTDIAPVGEG